MDLILKTLHFELEFVIFSLKDSFGGALILYLLGMLDEEIIFIHLGEVSLFPDLN